MDEYFYYTHNVKTYEPPEIIKQYNEIVKKIKHLEKVVNMLSDSISDSLNIVETITKDDKNDPNTKYIFFKDVA